jgi:tRNA dimethylallyltransferase
MKQKNSLPFLVAIVGPTASGKSALGICLAERLAGEIVACDSTQLFRGFDIGTAKPSAAERRGVPHHLLDVLDPGEAATAGGYRQLALPVLEDLRRRKRLPILTVGTGLYLRALLEGLADVPQRSEELRERLRTGAGEHAPGHLHRVLRRLDPEAARKIAPADEQKLIRAIEVCLLTRKPISEAHRAGRKPLEGWRVLKIGLLPPREELYERIRARTSAMLERGWMSEVEVLLKENGNEAAKPFDFIGYRELRAVRRNEMQLEQAREAIQQATRRYAKRQITWFRKEPRVQWFTGFGHDRGLQNTVLGHLRAHGVATPRGRREKRIIEREASPSGMGKSAR